MAQHSPFDRLEGAIEYVGLLRESLQATESEIRKEVGRAKSERAERRLEALLLVTYKLELIGGHLDTSHKLLGDLRTLRRLLLGE
jgi:hypothetical protein